MSQTPWAMRVLPGIKRLLMVLPWWRYEPGVYADREREDTKTFVDVGLEVRQSSGTR